MRPGRLARWTAACATAWACGAAPGMEYGVNIHEGGPDNARVAAVMKQRNFRTARMDLRPTTPIAQFRDQALRIRANGGSVQAMVAISYSGDFRCNPDLAFVERDAYRQTTALVEQVHDIVQDFELMNEVQRRPDIMREVPVNSAGLRTEPYEDKPCVRTLAAVLRGMSRAIHDAGGRAARPLRVIMGVAGRDWGLLTHLERQGVAFDVVGFHFYPSLRTTSMRVDPWFGPGGPLAQLARFGRPVHYNEFNCDEIYDPGYENRPGGAGTQACLQSLVRHLRELRTQTLVRIESLHFYELLDEPSKEGAEGRFGLMHDLSTPKLALLVATAFAGGTLSPAERQALTRGGLLTDREIDAMRAAAGP